MGVDHLRCSTSLETISTALSISSSVVILPVEKRIVPVANSRGTFMAASTCEIERMGSSLRLRAPIKTGKK